METGAKTRFQKKGTSKFPTIPGTKPSLYNYQLLSSTGIPALDNLLGGGLPVGTLMLIEDHPRPEVEDDGDVGSDYSNVILKYFMSEGAVHQHSLFYGSCSEKPDRFFSNLPEVVFKSQPMAGAGEPPPGPENEKSDDIKIAWRYKNQPSSSAPLVDKAPHTFNLQKTMNRNVIEACAVSSWSPPSFQSDESNYYRDIFAKLSAISENELFTLTPSPDNSKNILRISIHNLGSLLWVNEAEENGSKLTQFLLALRSLARQHLFVCVVTISQDSLASLETQNASLPRIRSLCDIVIQLKPFTKNERKNGLYKDHHGVMNLAKIANLNCLRSPVQQNCGKYLFKSMRTKFVIEKMHLPPDLGGDEKKTESGNKLDF